MSMQKGANKVVNLWTKKHLMHKVYLHRYETKYRLAGN
jgi:hypothetical protein